jgi:hypothetical protein
MATILRRHLPKLDTKKSSPSLLSSSDKSKTDKTVDAVEKRLNYIRIYLLNNKIHRKLTHTEPTLVFEKFLYLGGLKSLQDKVSFILFFV